MLTNILWPFWAFCLSLNPSISPPIAVPFAVNPDPSIAKQIPLSSPFAPPCLQGIINIYTPVLGFGCDSSTLSVGSTAGFAPGDEVLMIQMQVPQVDLSNTASFGTLLNSTCIGNYELNRVLSVGPNQIQLQYLLTRPYDLSGKIQLVRVPEYDSASVCNLTCPPWNGNTGGILVLDVKNKLILGGDVDVSAKGFRGGVVETNFIPWVFNETQYFYPPASTLAAAKGEGIVSIPLTHSYGRGRAGNGGGGGNAHNGGGGGGGNAGAGGNGGLEITNLPAIPNPNTDGIGGQQYFDVIPGKMLLGGGGGAGHANDQLGTPGGVGGGIMVLLAQTLQTNGFKLLANGENILGGINFKDGQGGGGGGGTILLDVNQVTGPLNCELIGGSGGSNPYIPDFQLHGPGGGGGGGKLMLSQNFPGLNASLQGGPNGLTSQGYTNGAQPGQYGKMLNGVLPQAGTEPVHPVSGNYALAIQSPPCASANGGQIEVIQSSALAFNLNGGPWQTQPVFSGLAPGNYQIGLKFSGGCTLDTTAVLTAPPAVLDSLVLLLGETCIAGGQIEVIGISGVMPFLYQLDGGSWQANGAFSGVSAGVHQINMRDAAGCTHSATYTVAPPPVFAAPVIDIAESCVPGGQIEVFQSAATAFRLNGGPWQVGSVFSGLLPGVYQIGLQFPAGCSADTVVVVSAPATVFDTLLALNGATCIAGGQLIVAANSGTSPFEFQLNGGAWQPDGTFPDLSSGPYTLVIRDAKGCTFTKNYAISSPAPVTDSLLLLLGATCVQGGQLTVTAVSGTAPFQFQLDGGSWQSDGIFSGLMPGNHFFTLRDTGGCTHSDTYTIMSPTPVFDTLLLNKGATCAAGGQLLGAAVSGTAPYTFQLDNGPWQSGGSFSGLSAGLHVLAVQDAAGCVDSGFYTIAPPLPVVQSLLSIQGASCAQGGQISVAASSGTAPYAFQVDGGAVQTGGVFSGLSAGTHLITLQDAGGCQDSGTYVIVPPVPVFDTLLLLNGATCDQGGQILVDGTSGTPPYQFQVNGGAWQNTGNFPDLPAGIYTITVRDSGACTGSGMYTVAPPIPVSDSLVTLLAATCVDGGTLVVKALAGTPPFQFQLNGGTMQNNGSFFDLPPGSYQLNILDGGGCTVTHLYTVPPPPVPENPVLLLEQYCDQSGQIQVIQAQAIGFSLDGGPPQPTGVFTGLAPGLYQIQLLFSGGCTIDTALVLPIPPLVLDSLVLLQGTSCLGGGRLIVKGLSGVPPFQFQLNGGAFQANGVFSNLPAGNYMLTLLDARGCTHTSTYEVTPHEPLMPSLDEIGSIKCWLPEGFLRVSASGGAGVYTYQLGQGVPQQNGTFSGLGAGIYTVTIRDSIGCHAVLHGEVKNLADSAHTYLSDTIYEGAFYVLPDGTHTNRPGTYSFVYQTIEGCDSLHTIDLTVLPRLIYAPNVIHPDDDGHNDFFTIFSDASVALIRRLMVFDRWGDQVFDAHDIPTNEEHRGWDGSFRGRPVGTGVYVWSAEIEFVDGLKVLLKGDVTVLR